MSVGEFEANLGYGISVRAAQLFFLLKAEELQPKLVDDLYILGAHKFSYLFSLGFCSLPNPFLLTPPLLMTRCKSIKHRIFDRAPSWREVVNDADAIAVRKALQEWSRKWNLNAEWCLD